MSGPTRESESMRVGKRLRYLGREYGAVYLKGMAMGTADAVPGVSGGTIALITGIYERLIAAVTAIDPSILGHLPGLRNADGRRRFVADLYERDVPFLVALGFGMVTAFLTVTRVADFALAEVPAITYAFFFGLIAASAVILYGEIDVSTPGRIVVAIVGFGLAFWVSGLGEGTIPSSTPVTFGAGTIAISAMVLPGISGSSLLLLMGQYEYLTGRLTDFVDAVIAVPGDGSVAAATGPGTTVGAFLVGATIGLFTITHAIKRALAAYRVATLTFLVSLLAGTLRLPVIEVRNEIDTWSTTAAGSILLAVVVGTGAVLLLDRHTDDLEY